MIDSIEYKMITEGLSFKDQMKVFRYLQNYQYESFKSIKLQCVFDYIIFTLDSDKIKQLTAELYDYFCNYEVGEADINKRLNTYIIHACNQFSFNVKTIKEAESVIQNKNRIRIRIILRNMLIALIRAHNKELSNESLQETGNRFHKDHATVLHSLKNAKIVYENIHDEYNEDYVRFFKHCRATEKIEKLFAKINERTYEQF